MGQGLTYTGFLIRSRMPSVPPPSRPHSASNTRTLRGGALVLLVVTLLHLWALEGLPVWRWQGATPAAPNHSATAWTTRVLPFEPTPSPLATHATPPASPPPPSAPELETEDSNTATALPRAETQDAASPAAPSVQEDHPYADTALASPATADPVVPPADAATPPPVGYRVPASVRLLYDVVGDIQGRQNVASAVLVWQRNEGSYEASLLISKFFVPLRHWTSKGALTPEGLAPARFGDKRVRGSELASHFVHEEGKVIFSNNKPEAALQPGAQDYLSLWVQLASIWSADPQRYAEGDQITLQAVGARQADMWTFAVGAPQTIEVPGGQVQAIKLIRAARGDYSTQTEIWLAPQLDYLPARIRLSEANGRVVDMLWSESQLP